MRASPKLELYAGLLLIGVSWTLNWLPHFTGRQETLRTHLLFFPLWLGFALVVDYLVWRRKGTSLVRRSWKAFAGLFIVSAPAWWFFELLNKRTANWIYLPQDYFSDLEYFLLASVAFSTVIPAVFGAAELASTWEWVKRLPNGPVIKPTQRTLGLFFVTGWVMFALVMAWPRYFFPFLWLAPYFVFDPVNVWLGNRSLFDYTREGNWRPVAALWAGTLLCGVFWELWNYYAYPKWIYDVPFVGVLHIFEMPALGYGGYLPFGMELFALYHLVVGGLSRGKPHPYVELS